MGSRWYDLAKRLIPRPLRTAIRNRILASVQIPSIWWSLANLRCLGFAPTQVIDCGAYDGNWARRCKEVFPQARVLCVEPQAAKEPSLRRVKEELAGVDYVISLAGKDQRENVPLFVNDTATTLHSYDGE